MIRTIRIILALGLTGCMTNGRDWGVNPEFPYQVLFYPNQSAFDSPSLNDIIDLTPWINKPVYPITPY